MTSLSSPAALWPAARVRGTLAVVTGRGERAAVYERFGQRISADGYTVAIFEADADAAAAWIETADAPRVLVGSDTGASSVLRVLTQGATADGAIIAGTPVDVDTDGAAQPADAERTACPLHLGVLGTDEARTAPVAVEPVPDAADLASIAVPVLAFHGGADTVALITEASALLNAVPDLELLETVGGLHDALNDQSHRSVAASIVLWLERLRSGDVHVPVVDALRQAQRAEVADV
ncbi:lysophospholipase [Microbacterium sp. CH12i]|uniref:alpha/beta hydrolase n=1 Tax=Microbacterium sp. CH12i TaxID=1479651 RepID=UPI00046201F7|nr:alpha/beta hydrolase [Microbacterium sp. CH12i]KDA05999.1 lysophospholipase [Microbacterium sp. CH12i]